jgi:hypothetical protein
MFVMDDRLAIVLVLSNLTVWWTKLDLPIFKLCKREPVFKTSRAANYLTMYFRSLCFCLDQLLSDDLNTYSAQLSCAPVCLKSCNPAMSSSLEVCRGCHSFPCIEETLAHFPPSSTGKHWQRGGCMSDVKLLLPFATKT